MLADQPRLPTSSHHAESKSPRHRPVSHPVRPPPPIKGSHARRPGKKKKKTQKTEEEERGKFLENSRRFLANKSKRNKGKSHTKNTIILISLGVDLSLSLSVCKSSLSLTAPCKLSLSTVAHPFNHPKPPHHHQLLLLYTINTNTHSGEDPGNVFCSCNLKTATLEASSGHHRPPLTTPPPLGQSPRPPLPNSTNR